MEIRNIFLGKKTSIGLIAKEDANTLSHWSCNGHFARYYDTAYAMPATKEAFEKLIENSENSNTETWFAIRTIPQNKLIGTVSLHSIEWNNGNAILSIGIGEKDYQNGGYGTDALQLILAYGFTELNLHRISLEVIAYNDIAINTYKKVGFKIEGTIRERVNRDNKRHNVIQMGILKKEWNLLNYS